jgi:hypothetical protein
LASGCHGGTGGEISAASLTGANVPLDPAQIEANTLADGYSPSPDRTEDFVAVPQTDQQIDYGRIAPQLAEATGMLELPIRLMNGRHFGAKNGGYGISHMLRQHAPAFALWEFFSVQDYVDHVASGFDAVYEGRDGRHLIVRRREPKLAVDRLLVIEHANARGCYSVVTGWFVSARRPVAGILIAERVKKDGVVVWECRAPHSKGPGLAQSDAPAG